LTALARLRHYWAVALSGAVSMTSNFSVGALVGAFASAFAGAFLASKGPVQASTVYTYTGPNFINTFILDETVPAGTYTTAMNVTGSFSVPSPLLSFNGTVVPDSFSFFDGRNTLTNLNTTPGSFILHTDASGAVLSWQISVNTPFLFNNVGEQTFRILTQGTTGVLGGFDEGAILEVTKVEDLGGGTIVTTFGNDRGASNNPNIADPLDLPPGTWSVAAAETPLPAALPLFATGLGALGLLGWRRKRKQTA